MKQEIYTIQTNRPLTADVYEMKLSGDGTPVTAPGQFIHIKLSGLYLRRPISVCDWTANSVTVIYKVVGKGTAALAAMELGKRLDVLAGLGNGFDVDKCGKRTVVIGGGVGTPPMYGLAKALLAAGKTPVAILGFNTKSEIFYEEQFRDLGIETFVTTVDGSYGGKGFVTDALPEEYDYFCACGPLPMLKALYRAAATPGLMSFEERMGCGFGACMGCSIQTKSGNKRVCKDGPVLEKEELLW